MIEDCPPTDDRLMRIEMTLANQGRQIDELSDMTAQQWTVIERLTRKMASLQDQMQDMAAGEAEGDTGEATSVTDIAAANKPPHY